MFSMSFSHTIGKIGVFVSDSQGIGYGADDAVAAIGCPADGLNLYGLALQNGSYDGAFGTVKELFVIGVAFNRNGYDFSFFHGNLYGSISAVSLTGTLVNAVGEGHVFVRK